MLIIGYAKNMKDKSAYKSIFFYKFKLVFEESPKKKNRLQIGSTNEYY